MAYFLQGIIYFAIENQMRGFKLVMKFIDRLS